MDIQSVAIIFVIAYIANHILHAVMNHRSNNDIKKSIDRYNATHEPRDPHDTEYGCDNYY